MTPVMSGGLCVSILTSCLGRSIYRLGYTRNSRVCMYILFVDLGLTTRLSEISFINVFVYNINSSFYIYYVSILTLDVRDYYVYLYCCHINACHFRMRKTFSRQFLPRSFTYEKDLMCAEKRSFFFFFLRLFRFSFMLFDNETAICATARRFPLAAL